MAHMIDMSNDRANIAFLGSRNDVWHRMGQEMQEGMSIADWAKAAGLDWAAEMQPAFALINGEYVEVDNLNIITRNDTHGILGNSTDRYKLHQPAEMLDWFDKYMLTDPRFALDVAGSLKGGATVWATARYNGEIDVVGEKHVMRVLMTTTYDGTRATINQATATRVVCDNTLRISLCSGNAMVKTRHSRKFDAARAAHELSELAKSFDEYRDMANALARQYMSKSDISNFFKKLLDIPSDQPANETHTRTLNQFAALSDAYRFTVDEGTPKETRWAALNAVTRYADHDRPVRASKWDSGDVARFLSANFGSGDQMKAKAVALLLDRANDIGSPTYVAPADESTTGVPVPASLAALV